MATIEKRCNGKGEVSYRIRVRVKGRPLQSATFRKKADALRWGRDTEAAIQQGRNLYSDDEATKHTMADLLNRYQKEIIDKRCKNVPTLTKQVKWWREQIGTYLLSEVTTALIVEYRTKLEEGITCRGKQRTPATVNRYLSVLSHAYRIAIDEWQWLEESPLKALKKRKEARGRTRFLSDEERMNLLEACKESKCSYLYTIVVLALSTGMRKGEITSLKWKNVDFERQVLKIEETKNGEQRSVPFVGLSRELLEKHSRIRRIDTDLLFPGRNSNQPIEIRTSWENVLNAAGIEDFRFHDLRHSCASYLAMNGATTLEIAEILGHKTLAMVKRYSHLSESHKFAVIESMNNCFIQGV